MSFGNCRNRIEQLEKSAPGAVTFYLPNGARVQVMGFALDIFNDAMAEIRQGKGPLYDVVKAAERADNFGRLLEILQAV